MLATLVGIEKRKGKNDEFYNIYHIAHDTNSTNVLGRRVVSETCRDIPADIQVDDLINLEYEKNGTYVNTIITHA